MKKGIGLMILLICGILLVQIILLTGHPAKPGEGGFIETLKGKLTGQDSGESLRAEKALTAFLDAWVAGDTDTLLGMLSAGPDAPKDSGTLLQQTLGRYRLSGYQMEGEITDLSSKQQEKGKSFSCRILIREPAGWNAFRLLPQMVKKGGDYLVDADSIRKWTRIPVTEYENPGTAVHEQM